MHLNYIKLPNNYKDYKWEYKYYIALNSTLEYKYYIALNSSGYKPEIRARRAT